MKNLILFIALSFQISLFHANSAVAANSCQQLLTKVDRHQVIDEVANAARLSELVSKEIQSKSRKTIAQLKKKNVIFDVICLGAGPQCAAASLVLGKSKLKALVVDKASIVASNFHEKDFTINSSETDVLSMHNFPGSPLKFDQIISGKYANSRQLAAYIQAQQYHSGVPVLLNTEVTGFKMAKEKNKDIVILTTENGLELKTRHLVIGTGLGEASTKIPTPFYQNLFKQMMQKSAIDPDTLMPIMSTETFMKALNVAPTSNKKLVMPKTLAVIGNGDGARITIEELLEPHVVMPEDFKIYWIGTSAKNTEEYIASQKGWDRYIEKIIPHYENHRIVAVPGYAIEAGMAKNGNLQIHVQDPTTKEVQIIETEMVIDSTGYENVTLKQLGEQLGQVSLKDIKGEMTERNQTEVSIARQVVLNEGLESPIYLVGAAAGPLLTKAEMENLPNKNPVSIFNNVGLTSNFISQLFGLTVFNRDLGEKSDRSVVESADTIYSRLQRK